jgi:hypothetical protein
MMWVLLLLMPEVPSIKMATDGAYAALAARTAVIEGMLLDVKDGYFKFVNWSNGCRAKDPGVRRRRVSHIYISALWGHVMGYLLMIYTISVSVID